MVLQARITRLHHAHPRMAHMWAQTLGKHGMLIARIRGDFA
jgi:hypothetical protein